MILIHVGTLPGRLEMFYRLNINALYLWYDLWNRLKA